MLQLQRHAQEGEPTQRTFVAMRGPVRVAYDALIAANQLKPDPAQQRAVAALDRLAASFGPTGFFSRLFGSQSDGPAGVYLWGGVGRGKSMLMDLAFEHIDIHPKRRVHFHAIMIETHHRLREARRSAEGDPIEPVAEQIADEARLLCFDEMQVTNPADAMILSRLFAILIEKGVKVVTTSTAPPPDSTRTGLTPKRCRRSSASTNRAWLSSKVTAPPTT